MVRAFVLAGAAVLGVLTHGAAARAGFISVLVSAGADGSATPSTSNNFQFTNPSGSSQVALNQATGTGSLEAGTGGGVSFLSPSGTPVVFNLADGTAYVASSTAPDAAKPMTGLATGAPLAGAPLPLDAALLGITASDPAADHHVTLVVSVTGSGGNSLGSTQVSVPGGGWWVIGLTPGTVMPPPLPVEPGPGGPPTDPLPTEPLPPPPLPPTPPTAATPEPATVALVGLGLPFVGVARRFRNRSLPA